MKEKLIGISVGVSILFLSIIFTGSEAYSQCSTLTPAAPSSLTLAVTATVSSTPTSPANGTDSSLVGYWKFDEGTGSTACDSSGKGNNGTLINGPLRAIGKVGGGLYFDGIDDNITIADSNSLDLSSSFTLSAWVNPASTSTDFRSILVKNYKYYLYASAGGYCGNGNPLAGFDEQTTNAVCQPAPLPANTWTHLAATYSGSILTLYRNGVAVATSNISKTLSPTTGTLQIGASQFGENFKGLIDEVRVHNRSLSITEVQAIFQQESGDLAPSSSPVTTAPATGSLFSFSLANSGDKSVIAGSSVTNSITASLVSASSQAISFSASGLPSGANTNFSSGSCTPGCSTVLTISTTGSTPVGNFPIIVSSTGGGVTKTTAFTLSVTLALTVTTPTISPNGGNFSDSISVAMQTTTSGASVYYTTDGSTPTQSSIPYNGAMTLTSSSSIKAKAFKSGSNPSAVASASFTKNSGGSTYYVAPHGSDLNPGTITNPFKTITKAIGSLRSGDTLYIRGGTYNERFPWPVGGSPGQYTTISGYQYETVTIRPTSSPAIIGGGSSANSYTRLVRLIFDGINAGTGDGAIGMCCAPNAPQFVTIEDVEIKNWLSGGIHLYTDNITIRNSRIHDNGFQTDMGPPHGLYVEGSYNVFEGNEVYNHGFCGFHLYSGTRSVSNNIIRRNSIHHNAQLGITPITPAGVNCAGILMSSGSNNQAYNNIVHSNGIAPTSVYGAGIEIYSRCSDCKAMNNTIYGNNGVGINVYPGLTGTAIRNNIVTNNSRGSIVNQGTATLSSNNLTTDPKFINPLANDFRLQNGSLAIDAGINLSPLVIDDFDERSRLSGSAYDIGAYEY